MSLETVNSMPSCWTLKIFADGDSEEEGVGDAEEVVLGEGDVDAVGFGV
jgi:hypothetical protein